MKPGRKAKAHRRPAKRPRGRSVEQAAALRHAAIGRALDERQREMSGEVRVRRVDPATLRPDDPAVQ